VIEQGLTIQQLTMAIIHEPILCCRGWVAHLHERMHDNKPEEFCSGDGEGGAFHPFMQRVVNSAQTEKVLSGIPNLEENVLALSNAGFWFTWTRRTEI